MELVIRTQASREGTRATFKGLEVSNCVTLNGADLIDTLPSREGENSGKELAVILLSERTLSPTSSYKCRITC